jgi:hypothetical protein
MLEIILNILTGINLTDRRRIGRVIVLEKERSVRIIVTINIIIID